MRRSDTRAPGSTSARGASASRRGRARRAADRCPGDMQGSSRPRQSPRPFRTRASPCTRARARAGGRRCRRGRVPRRGRAHRSRAPGASPMASRRCPRSRRRRRTACLGDRALWRDRRCGRERSRACSCRSRRAAPSDRLRPQRGQRAQRAWGDHDPATMLITAILTAMPNVTCGRITARSPSATGESISTPRFIGPGCITIASGLASASFSCVRP
jgi:hypothetical protein